MISRDRPKHPVRQCKDVGYQSYSLDTEDPNDYIHNIGVQFKQVSGEPYVITDTFFGTPLNPGDQLFIFDPEYYGYTLYEYGEIEVGVFGFGVTFASGDGGDPVYSITINKGDNVLYMPQDLTTVPSVSGEVAALGSQTLTFTLTETDYIFPITNPYPQATKLSDLTCLEPGDQLFVWDSLYYGYTLYEYGEIEAGVFGLGVTFASGDGGDPITDPDFVVLGAGQGGMYMPTGDRSWTVTLD